MTDTTTGPAAGTRTVTGRIWLFGDDMNTDVIHPPSFFSLDPEKVKRGLFHGYDPTIQPNIQPDDIIVAGRNFGCGSSRETSIRAIKLNRIGAVVAVDFGRIFFRNATNNGLPCLPLTDPADLAKLTAGQRITVDPYAATLTTEDGELVRLEPPGEFISRIWAAGGLLQMLPGAPAE
jgi:3-isopropylmalate dehydratase small subunit